MGSKEGSEGEENMTPPTPHPPHPPHPPPSPIWVMQITIDSINLAKHFTDKA